MLTQRKQEIVAKVSTLIEVAKSYGFSIPDIHVYFTLKGTAAGRASRRVGVYSMNFNARMMLEEWDHIINDTVPHELAHILCYYNPVLGKNHDAGWKRICVLLGGSGKSTHNKEVMYAKGKTYEYTTEHGMVVRLSQTRHNRIQAGAQYYLMQNGKRDQIHKDCAYKVL